MQFNSVIDLYEIVQSEMSATARKINYLTKFQFLDNWIWIYTRNDWL